MRLLLACAAGLFAASTASAATITFETDESGYISVGSVSGVQTGGVPQGPFSAGGTTFTVDADTFDWNGGNVTLNDERNIEITQNSEGIGIDNNNGLFGADSSEIDGSGSNDILIFSFHQPIRLFHVVFENVTNNDDFVFYRPDASPRGIYRDIVNPSPLPGAESDEGYYNFGGLVTSVFGLGALGSNDNFRVSRIEFSVVPLPASALLLLGGLGGLAALRRRKS